MTVLFCDVTSFTALGEQNDPEALRGAMDRYFATARGVIESHGGVVEKFIGDAVMAVFGLRAAHEDDAVRALRAAHELQNPPEDRKADAPTNAGGIGALRLRIGVSSGEVIARTADDGQAFVTGDTVNVAARLQQAAKPGDVLIDEPTMQLARAFAAFEPGGELDLRGRQARTRAFRLVSVNRTTDRPSRAEATQLVGRATELKQLTDALDRAGNERRPYLFTIVGAPGVGKSRLVRELASSNPTLSGRCLPYGEGITYWPIREVADAIVDGEGTPSDLVAALDARLAHEPDGALIAARIAATVGWTDETIPADESTWAVRRLFEAEATQAGRLVIVVDDIQWAEPRLLDVIEHVLDWARDAPLLIVCLARPEVLDIRPTWGGGRINATALLLEPLRGDAARAMVAQLADTSVVPETVERILEVADGVPLFIEQIVAALGERGLSDAPGGASRVPIPTTIQSLLQARVDDLPDDERRLLAAASVIGESFDRTAVGALAGVDDSVVDQALLGTMRRQLTGPQPDGGAGTFRFRHLLIRDAAYERMPKSERAVLHERLAEWLTSRRAEQLGVEEIIGHHLEAACRYRSQVGLPSDPGLIASAIHHLRAAAVRAQRRGDWAAAGTFVRRALALVADDAADRMDLMGELGETQYRAGDYAGAIESLDGAIALAGKSHDRGAEFRFRALRAEARRATDPAGGSAEARALTAIDREAIKHDDRALVAFWELQSGLADYDGRLSDGIAAIGRALEHAKRLGDPAILERLHDFQIHLSLFGAAALDDVGRQIERRLSEIEPGSLRYSQALARSALVTGLRGDVEGARRILDEAAAIHGGVSTTQAFGAERDTRAAIEAAAENFPAAEAAVRDICTAFEQTGDKYFASTYLAALASVVAQQGRPEEAKRLAARADDLAAPDDWWVWCYGAIARTYAALSDGMHGDALALSSKAVEIADQHEVLGLRGDARMARAAALHAAGDTGGAKAVLEEARDLALGYGALLEVRRAERAMERLGPGR